MTEYFRITGKNLIQFDAGPTGNYLFTQGRPPRKLSTVLTRKEVLAVLPRLPLGARPMALKHGLSVITMEFNIQGASDTDMEDKQHDLTETLVETELFFSSLGDMGTRAVLTVKSDGAVATSYKSVFFGVVDELDARDVLGAIIRAHRLEGLRLTLYCEPYWRPEDAVELGANEIQTPSFEEYGGAAGLADHWTALNVPVTTIENTIVLHGCDSQQIDTNMAGEGIASATMVAPTGITDAVAYAWICRPAAGTDIQVVLRDTSVGADRDVSLYSSAGWPTDQGGGQTWYRVLVVSNAIVPGNNHQLWIYSVTDTVTTWYVDETMWIWGTIIAPDEWIGYGLIYNHYDSIYDYPNHIDHLNYLDFNRLKGDVDSRLRIEMQSLYADTYGPSELTVARRTDPCLPCQFVHFLEAELATTQTNWADFGAADESGGNSVGGGGASTSGHVIWDYTTLGYNLACQKGRFRVLGRMYAAYSGDVDANVKFRATVGMVGAHQQSRWLQPLIADAWHWLDFGVFEVTGQFWGDELPSTLYWRVDYQKEAADQLYFDFLLLLPEDESILRILLGDYYLAGPKSYTAATIAFAATTPGTITDAAAGLVIFLTGDRIQVTGSANNDGYYTVSTGGVAATIRTVEPTVFEAAGATVTIATYEDALWDNTFDFTLAMKRHTDAFVYHPPVQAEPLALRPDEQNRLIFAMGHYFSAAFPYKGCYVHEDNDERMLVSLKYLPQFVSPLE